MVKRRYADYLKGDESTDAQQAGDAKGPDRAWLQRAEADDDEHPPPAFPPEDEWTLTLEKTGRATNHAGTFESLVDLAREAGIDDFRVWSTAKSDFEEFTADTVHPLD